MVFSIAWKNIWRNKLRSLVVIAAVTVGLIAGIFGTAIMLGMVNQRVDSAIKNETSHIQLHNPKFLENKEIQYAIADPVNVEKKILQNPEVKAVSRRIRFTGMVSSANSATGSEIIGINPETEKMVTSLNKTIRDSLGNYFGSNIKNPVLISEKLAKKLKVKLKSKIIIRFQNIEGNITESAFKICGLFQTSNSVFDETMVFVRNTDLIPLLGDGEDLSHEIVVFLKESKNLDKAASELKSQLPALNVMTWKEVLPELGTIISIMDIYTYVFVIIILFALSFGIINTMLMVVLERFKELGMLMAIGMNKTRIFSMIMLETILLTLTGAVAGMILSELLIIIYGNIGIDISGAAEGMQKFGYSAVIYPEITVQFYIILTILVICTGIISAIYPARKALKLRPIEALKTD